MENSRFIKIESVCNYYQIDLSFIQALNEYGLISIVELEEGPCIEEDYLTEIEKMMRLHYELDINMAGLDAISHLLKKLHESQKDLQRLRNSYNTSQDE